MEHTKTFGARLGCMDGREEPATAFAKKLFGVDIIDTITEPGMDGLLAGKPYALDASADASDQVRAYVRAKAEISVKKHGSNKALITGHCDCAGNPVALAAHIEDLRAAKRYVESWGLFEGVHAAVFDEDWNLKEIM